jgi:CcmD family protein
MNLEQVPNTFPHLFVGYGIIFSILAIYIFSLAARTRRLEKKLSELERAGESSE